MRDTDSFKDVRFEFRTSRQNKKIIFAYAKKYKISASEYMELASINYSKNMKNDPNLKELIRGRSEKEALKQLRESAGRHYLLTNVLRRIRLMWSSSCLIRNKSSRNSINKIIDDAIKYYNTFPNDDKKLLKGDIEDLKKLKKPNVLEEKMQLLNRLFKLKAIK